MYLDQNRLLFMQYGQENVNYYRCVCVNVMINALRCSMQELLFTKEKLQISCFWNPGFYCVSGNKWHKF